MHPLEGGREVTDVSGGGLLEQADFAFGDTIWAESQAHVLQEGLTVLEIDECPIESAIERFTPHSSTPRVARTAAAVARV